MWENWGDDILTFLCYISGTWLQGGKSRENTKIEKQKNGKINC